MLIGGFKYFLCSPRTLGKMNPFWRYNIFQLGWFNHQLDIFVRGLKGQKKTQLDPDRSMICLSITWLLHQEPTDEWVKKKSSEQLVMKLFFLQQVHHGVRISKDVLSWMQVACFFVECTGRGRWLFFETTYTCSNYSMMYLTVTKTTTCC